MKRKGFILLLAVVLMFNTVSVFAVDFSDIENHWAEEQIKKWSSNELVSGYDGKFNPNDPINRAEMAALINKLFQYQIESENPYTDVAGGWYEEAILKGHAKGIMKETSGAINPTGALSRQEAVLMISRAFNIEPVEGKTIFKDDKDIASWAKGYINAMNKKGYVAGNPDGSFYPLSTVTRAEVVMIFDNIIGAYYHKAGTYSDTVEGVVVINTPDVVLENMNIKGDVIVAEGVAEGDFTIKKSTVKGEMFVYGGGENSVKVFSTKLGKVVLDKKNSSVRIVSDTTIDEIILEEDAFAIVDGLVSITDIVVKGNSEIEVRGDVTTENVSLEGEKVKAVINGKVENLKVQEAAKDAVIEGKGKVNKLHGDAKDVDVDVITGPTKSSDNSSAPTPTPVNPTSQYTYTVEKSFIGAPTSDIKVYRDGVLVTGYTLYVDNQHVAKDVDNDGVVSTLNQFFESGKVVAFSDNQRTMQVVSVK